MVARRMLPGFSVHPPAQTQPGKAAPCGASWRAGRAAAGESRIGLKGGSQLTGQRVTSVLSPDVSSASLHLGEHPETQIPDRCHLCASLL